MYNDIVSALGKSVLHAIEKVEEFKNTCEVESAGLRLILGPYGVGLYKLPRFQKQTHPGIVQDQAPQTGVNG